MNLFEFRQKAEQCEYSMILFHNHFIGLMSVNTQILQALRSYLPHLHSSIRCDLSAYHSYLSQSQTHFLSAVAECAERHQKQYSLLRGTIEVLEQQLMELREKNERLVRKSKGEEVRYEELRRRHEEVVGEGERKEQRVRELMGQVDKIRNYISELKKEQQTVNFDEGGSFEGLETIKEVSEHDLSVTMSMQSFKSQILDQNQFPPATKTQFQQASENSEVNVFQIQNYHDALQILKNYNSGNGATMAKKHRLDYYDLEAKQNIASLAQNVHPDQHGHSSKAKKNDTIAKIKKMRKIQNLDLESGYVVKSQKKPLSIIPISHQQSDYSQQRQSKYEQLSGMSQQPNSGRSSSTRMKSRVREQLVSLVQPVRAVNQIVQRISAVCRYPLKVVRLRESVCVVGFADGFQYRGHCDDRDRPCGFGKLMIKGEAVYQGEWREGRLHGWGKLVLLPFQRGRERAIIQVDGNFRTGAIAGTVVCLFNTGERFMGVMRGGGIEEEGTFVGAGGILTGQWSGSSLVLLI